ncbi:MAG: MarR family transcriptional regulator, partial [Solirubrobacterales bacterium]|nr:MarR family transcriptional regulator [Solirubrobacterales bacterium]
MAPLIAADASVRNPAFEVEGTDTAAWRSVGSSYLILVEYIESRFARAGLPELAWFDVLAALEASEEPVRPRDLLCRVRVTKSGLTRLLDRIETEGLIRRSR